MKNTLAFLLITLFMGTWLTAQVKIGDNPQNIDPSSVLELESTDKVLVITRVTTAQMNAIVPIQGALCYNTEVQAVHYFDGTQWVNIGSGGGTGGTLTADPIVNAVSTIVITPTGAGDNLEVAPNSINSAQIVDGGVNGVDIQDGSIGPGKLQDDSVTEDKLSENSVGEEALDNANIDLGDFNNIDVGYITNANLLSTDLGNALQLGTIEGLYYDEGPLNTLIQNNTDAINAIGVPNLNEVLQQGNNALNLKIEGLATPTNPADAATKAYVDAQAAAGGSDNQDIGPLSLIGNILSIGIEDGIADTIDLSALAGGGSQNLTSVLGQGNNAGATQIKNLADPTLAQDAATKAYVDANIGGGGNQNLGQVLAQGTDGGAALIKNILDPVDNQDAATKAYVDANGGNQNLGQVLAQGTDGGAALIKNILDPVDNQDAATKAYVDAAITGGGSLTDGTILIGGTGNIAQQLAISGDATLANDGALTIANNAINTAKITNATILAEDLADMGATDGQILKWNNTTSLWEIADDDTGTATLTDGNIYVGGTGDVPTDVTMSGDATIDNTGALAIADDAIMLNHLDQNGAANGDVLKWDNDGEGPGVGGWVTSSAAAHFGTENSIFFADDATGAPTEDNASFAWDPDYRLGTGQLQIGLEGNIAPTDVSKVVIAETPSGGLDVMYPLLVQTSAPAVANASTGILFSPEVYAPGTLAKGALIYQRTGDWATGDFHFLQNTQIGGAAQGLLKPTTADKAFTVKNNSDIVLYGGIDIDGIGLGGAGEVLTSTGTGVQWGLAGGGTDNQNIEGSVLTGETLTIGIEDGTNQDVDLATFALETEVTTAIITSEALDLDKDNTNEIQAITSTDNSVTISASGNDFDLSVAGGGTDNQNIEGSVLTGETLTIGIEDGTNQDVDLAPFALETEMTTAITASEALDLDKDNANEIQSVTAADGTIIVTPVATNDFTVAVGTISGGASGNIATNSITQGDLDTDSVGAGEILSDAVSSDEIDDDSIMNVDIAAAAAIDGSKINPTFTAQIDATLGMTSGADILMNGFTVVPDYVFQKYFSGNSTLKESYNFKSLEEIETFVKKNHHLPGIKSAYQVQKEGSWNLSDSNLKNLEKIEELFLHTIEQENKIKVLQSENATLIEKLESMNKAIQEIKTLIETKE